MRSLPARIRRSSQQSQNPPLTGLIRFFLIGPPGSLKAAGAPLCSHSNCDRCVSCRSPCVSEFREWEKCEAASINLALAQGNPGSPVLQGQDLAWPVSSPVMIFPGSAWGEPFAENHRRGGKVELRPPNKITGLKMSPEGVGFDIHWRELSERPYVRHRAN